MVAANWEWISIGLNGAEPNGDSVVQDVSADGRYLLFSSSASNLVAGDGNGLNDLFLFDRKNQTTELISSGDAGLASGFLGGAEISADGKTIVYGGYGGLLDGGGQGTPVVIKATLGGPADIWSGFEVSSGIRPVDPAVGFAPSVSADGGTVAFIGLSSNPGEVQPLLYVPLGWTPQEIGRLALSMGLDSVDLGKGDAAVSANGRYVAFGVGANLLAELPSGLASDPTEPNAEVGTFVHDLQTGKTQFVSQKTVLTSDGYANLFPTHPALSADGREVAFGNGYFGHFKSYASTNGGMSVVDRVTGQELADVNEGISYNPANDIEITADGSIAAYAFTSYFNSPYSGIIVADVKSGTILAKIGRLLAAEVALTPDGSGMAVSGHDGSYFEQSEVYYLQLNHAPSAVADAVTIVKSAGATVIDVLANDTDKDAGDSRAISAVDTAGILGKVAFTGSTLTYDPAGAFADLPASGRAVEKFSYTITDGAGASATATVTVTVTVEGAGGTPSRQITGNATDNKLNGTKLDDDLAGLGGSDKLNGKAGNDRIDGGSGDDLLTGGPGADRFVIGGDSGRDAIKDFRSEDQLDLSAVLGSGELPASWLDGLKAGDAGVSAAKKALAIDLGLVEGGAAGIDVLTLKGVSGLALSSLLTE